MKLKEYIFIVTLFHFLVYIAIGFDIPVARQVLVFLYLIFVPGFVFFSVLKVGKISLFDLILLSVGLSIALLMFVGLFVNQIYPILGVSQPLSQLPLVLTMSVLTLVFFVVGCKQDIGNILELFSLEKIAEIPVVKAALIMCLPIMSVVAAVYANNLLPFLIVAISLLFVVSALSAKLIPPKLYPLLIFCVSLSLALQFTLLSKHVMGSDAPLEYFVYKLTALEGYWNPLNAGGWPQPAFHSMLSITMLPTVYSVLLKIDGELLFKILYPVVFSFVPLVLYRIIAKENWKLIGLLSALFFISSPIVFYGVEPLSVNRQIIAELMLLLSVFLLLEKQFSIRNKRLFFIMFGAALAVSHYTLTIIYLIFLAIVLVFERVKIKQESVLNGRVLLLLSGIAFSWYTLVPTNIAFQLSRSISHLIYRFGYDLFSPAARSNEIFTAHPVSTIASTINWTLFIVAHFFVLLGILAIVLNRQGSNLGYKYRIMVVLGSVLLFLAIAVPNLAPTLNFTRYYAITFLFLAPCFVFGGRYFFLIVQRILNAVGVRLKGRSKNVEVVMLLIAIVAGAYFLSQSGYINHVTGGSPLSYTLDWDRIKNSENPQTKMGFYIFFIPEQDIEGAIWLSRFMENGSFIYSDFTSMEHPLKIFGLIPDSSLDYLTNQTTLGWRSYIYLRYFNVVDGFVTPFPTRMFNTSELFPVLNKGNCVYSNGGNQVYATP